MTKAAFELHVGDLKILKPESQTKRLPCGTTTQGYFTRYQKNLVGEEGVYVVNFSDAKRLDADIMDEGDAYYDGAQEDTFDNFSKEASQNPSFHGLKSVAEYKQAEEAKKKLEENK